MTPDVWTDRLSEYLDGELEPTAHEECRQHIAGCRECLALLTELRALAVEAAALTDRAPTTDLWAGIANRLGASRTIVPLAARRRRIPMALAAGIALLAVGGGSLWVGMQLSRAPSAGVTASTPATVPPDGLPVQLTGAARVERTADAAVQDLEGVLRARRDALDSTTIAVLKRNLNIIDSAIADAEVALRRDPADAYLNSHLARTVRRKIDILRQAAVLTQPGT